MMDLNEWIAQPANVAKYKQWLDNPITDLILSGLAQENKPTRLPLGNIVGEKALYFQGIDFGRYEILDRLNNLDQVPMTVEDAIVTYGLEEILMEQHNISQVEAQRMIKAAREKGAI